MRSVKQIISTAMAVAILASGAGCTHNPVFGSKKHAKSVADVHPIIHRSGIPEKLSVHLPNAERDGLPSRRAVLLAKYPWLKLPITADFEKGVTVGVAVQSILPKGMAITYGDLDYRTPVEGTFDHVALYDVLTELLSPISANFIPHRDAVKLTRTQYQTFRIAAPDVMNQMSGMVGNMLTSGMGMMGGYGGIGGGYGGMMGGYGGMGGGYGGMGGGSGGSSGLISVNMTSGMVTFWQSLQNTLNGMASGDCTPPIVAAQTGGMMGGQGGYGGAGGAGGYGQTSGASYPIGGPSVNGYAPVGPANLNPQQMLQNQGGMRPGGGPGNGGAGQNVPGLPGISSSVYNQSGKTPAIPCGHIRVDTESGYVYVWDTVDSVFRIDQYLQKIKRLLNRQVYLKVDIVEVQLNDTNQYGINWNSLIHGIGSGLAMTATGASGLNAGLSSTSTPAPYTIGVANGTNTSSAIINALSTYGKTHVVNQPRILAISGQPDTINVTQNIPYLQSLMPFAFGGLNSSSEVIPEIGYATTGLSLEVSPVIDGDKVHLHIVPILNTLTQMVSINVQNVGQFQEPEINSRATSNDITVQSGQTVFFGGLVSDSIINNYWTVPGLGSIPLLRYLFSGYNLQREVDELVLIVTPIVTENGKVIETEVPSTHDLMHLHQDQAPLRMTPQRGISIGPSTGFGT